MEYQVTARTSIVPSPLNPRKNFDRAKLGELALSMMNGVGIIEPLVVRPLGKKFELIAGERRWRAAEIAGLADVPVVIKEMTAAQVLEIMVIENNQREDISPLEEASGYQQLLKLANTGRADDGPKLDVDVLAHRLGRSRKYVYDRIKLLSLVPEAQELLALRRITAGHAILLARLTPAEQQVAIDPKTAGYDYDEGGGLFRHAVGAMNVIPTADLGQLDAAAPPTKGKKVADPYRGLALAPVRDFQAWIRDNVRLKVGSVEAREEFPALQAMLEKADAVVSITHDYNWQTGDDPNADGNESKVYCLGEWRCADGRGGNKKCASAVTGLAVVGRDRGAAFPVCIDKACKVHFPPAPKAAKASSTTSSGLTTKQRQAAAKRQAAQSAKIQRENATWRHAIPVVIAALAAKMSRVKPLVLGDLVLAADIVWASSVKQARELLKKSTKDDASGVLQRLALAALIEECGPGIYYMKRIAPLAKRVGVDVKALLKKVQTSAPKTKAV